MNGASASVVLALLLPSFFTGAALAQDAAPVSAPLPVVLSQAKTLFIGNAGDQENADCLRAYQVFYQGVEDLHRFRLVTNPAAADMVLELHYEIDLGASIVSDHGRDSVRQFRVALIDRPTRIVVWSLTERTNYAVFQKNRNKNLDQTVVQLVADFASLTAPQPAVPNNRSRVTH